MSRPLRIEFAGAIYHVTSRGDGQDDIYLDDSDRRAFLAVLSEVCKRFNWDIHAYCLMSNHYHLVVETPDGNLSKGMRQLNGVYTQRFNNHHARVGHVFQGRYKSIIVQKEAYLLELCRYVVLNPVRARMTRSARAWPWSSYRATTGEAAVPEWLNTEWVLSAFAATRGGEIEKYREFVSQGKNQPSPWDNLKNQVFLGDEQFVSDMQSKLQSDQELTEVPRAQKRKAPKPLDYYSGKFKERNDGIVAAYQSGGHSMKEVGDHFGIHYSSVSKIIKKYEDSRFKT